MMKSMIVALSLLSSAAVAAQDPADAAAKRNNRINTLCNSLVQVKYNYSDLKGAERDARNRQHAGEIQSCFQAHSASATTR
jgi:hypothetical protein